MLREDETEVPDYLKKGLEVTNRFQDIVAQEHIAGRTGNEILKSSLERAKQEGIRSNAVLSSNRIFMVTVPVQW